jgi:hypothetical protein
MKFLFVFLSLFILVPSVSAQQNSAPDLKGVVTNMILNHPDVALRNQMGDWIKNKRMLIVVEEGIGELGSEYRCDATNPNSCWPVLLVRPDFLQSTFVPPMSDKVLERRAIQAEKLGNIYHEYVHLKNHFAGKYRLDGGINKKSLREQARYYWGTEKEAYRGQWLFLKAIGMEFVFFQKPGGTFNESAFFEDFYRSLRLYPYFDKLKNFLEEYYKAEKKQIK